MPEHAHAPSPNVSIPTLREYTKAVHDSWTRLYPNIPIPAHGATADHFPAPPVTYVATGSPEALRAYVAAHPPATATFALDLSTNQELRALAPEHAYDDANFREVPIGERVSLTRGVIVDLALMSGLWEEDGFVVPGAAICVAGCVVPFIFRPMPANGNVYASAQTRVNLLPLAWVGSARLRSTTANISTTIADGGCRWGRKMWNGRDSNYLCIRTSFEVRMLPVCRGPDVLDITDVVRAVRDSYLDRCIGV